MREIFEFLKNIRVAYADWKLDCEQFRAEQTYAYRLEQIGFPGDAAHNIGTAIILARKYDIELHNGMTYADCRAVLPREAWRNDCDDPDALFHAGQFMSKPCKEVTEIQMIDGNVCFAITKCLLVARQAGVI